MRRIDADAFAMYLQLICKGNDMSTEKKVFSANDVIHMLQDMPTSEEKWIPVSEKLPESKEVLVTVRDTHEGGSFVSIDRYWPYSREWFNNDQDVIAWMELPEPYGVKEE